MINVTVYYREQNAELDQLLADLQTLQAIVPHQLVMLNISSDKPMQEKLGHNLPVVRIGPYHLKPPFTRQDLQIMLSAARDRVDQLERVDTEAFQKKVARGRTMSSSDRTSYWLSRHYLAMVNLLVFLFVGLPFMAPVLMKTGQPFLANLLYKAYSPTCHQLAFRSWFLFGEQAYYPRELASIPGITYEQLTDTPVTDLLAARNFVGNEVLGYKVAICQRDVAIYGAMFLFGLFYAATGRKLRSVPWFIWIIIGLLPIAVDGTSQLTSFLNWFPSWIPVRESTPLLRTITGGLFGWMTAWYLFPLIEETARETQRVIQYKQALIEQSERISNP
jgi:uncharacterized membrane protein